MSIQIPRCRGVFLLLFSVLIFNGCSDGRHTLDIAVHSIPEQLDPVFSGHPDGRRIAAHIYESLFTQNEQGDMLPHLARDCGYDTSHTRLTIHLKEGIRFHDGDELNAGDVVYSLQRIIDAAEDDLVWVGTSSEQLGEPLSIQALDDLTVEIVLPSPHHSLLRTLTTPFLTPVVKEDRGPGPDRTHPIGTGPYRMTDHSSGRRDTILERFDSYWGVRPESDRIRFRTYSGDEERLDALIKGKADIALNIAIESVDSVNDLPSMRLVVVNQLSWMTLGINNQAPPFDDVSMRRVLAMVLETDVIVEQQWQSAGEPMRFFIARGLEPDIRGEPAPEYNAERALLLLSQVSTQYSDSLVFLRSPGPIPEKTEKLVNLLQMLLRDYGFALKQEYFDDFSKYNARLGENDWHLIVDGYTPDNGDLSSFLFDIYGRKNPDGSTGLFHMEGAEFLTILQQANATIDADEREHLFRSAVAEITDQIPCIPLADFKSFLVQSTSVDGLVPGPFSDWTFSTVTKEKWK